VVLALPGEQTRGLVAPLAGGDAELRGLLHLLGLCGTQACLTLIAAYPAGEVEPAWEMAYPEESRVLLLAAHESSKRPGAHARVLVYQARPTWSAEHLEVPAESWSAELLAEAARLWGRALAAPTWTRAHRWRFARTDLGSELGEPLLLPLGGRGAQLGVAGELFGRGAGVQAAYLSGRALARRILDEGSA
jgi:hypothetical protein